MTIIHVATTGSDSHAGTEIDPLRSIDAAAQRAQPGDTVIVHEGEYREWVSPRLGGVSETRRITYRAAEGERVVVKGSERVTGWEDLGGGIWRVQVPNTLFGGFNPYAEEIEGDWIVYDAGSAHKHLGEVYLRGRSFYEVATRDDLAGSETRTEVVDHWTGTTVPVLDEDQTRYRWTAEVGDEVTTIWANFQHADPNAELVEINVRRSVFWPREHHVDYITVKGFELAHAATPWAPPTADQPGLIGPNWAKGWIIEDNVIHDAKCSAISLGKETSTGHNFASVRGDKPGYQYQLESVFRAREIGWDREHVGSHIVRRNTVFDCGQNGIVGHLGCVFSTIEDNHIHHIAVKREFYGYEIGAIKLHAAIDVQIRRNRIHDSTLGTWLDWQTQGTRVSRNLYYRNSRDLFVEVSHGPYIVDHNVLASPASIESFSQGGAYIGNLVAGTLRLEPVMDRATPYHAPHSTQVTGYALIHGGDDRIIGNVFLGGDADAAYGPRIDGPVTDGISAPSHGTAGYDAHPSSWEEYERLLEEAKPGDHQRFIRVAQPVYIRDNVYAAGAQAYAGETGARLLDGDVSFAVIEEGDEVYLESRLPTAFDEARVDAVAGRGLRHVRLVGADFEEPDGAPAVIDVDLVGESRTTPSAPGPIAGLRSGDSRIRVW